MGLRKEAMGAGSTSNPAAGKDGKMTISSICAFLQDEWRSHEAAKNQWLKERKTILGRVAELEKQCATLKGAVSMYERRMLMLENVLRQEKGYPALEIAELPSSESMGDEAIPVESPLATIVVSPPNCTLPLPPSAESESEMAAVSLECTPPAATAESSELQEFSDPSVTKDLFGAKANVEEPKGDKSGGEELAMVEEVVSAENDDLQSRPREHSPPDRSAAFARPPSPLPSFLPSAGVLNVTAQDPEQVHERRSARERLASSIVESQDQNEEEENPKGANVMGPCTSEEIKREEEGFEALDLGEAEAGESMGQGAEDGIGKEEHRGTEEVEGGKEVVSGTSPLEEGSGVLNAAGRPRVGRRAVRAVVLQSRAAEGMEEEGSAVSNEERVEKIGSEGNGKVVGGGAGRIIRFRASISSGFASNVGAGFQSGEPDEIKQQGASQQHHQAATGSGSGKKKAWSGGHQKGASAKSTGGGKVSKRPPPLKKPDADEEIRALAVDLGIWTEDESSPRVPKSEVAVTSTTTEESEEGKAGEELVASPVTPSSLGHVEGASPQRMLPTRQRSRESLEGGVGTSSTVPSFQPEETTASSQDALAIQRTGEDLNWVGDIPAAPRSPQNGGCGGNVGHDGAAFWHRRQPLRSHLLPVWGMSLCWDTTKGDNSLTLVTASEDTTIKLWSIAANLTDISSIAEVDGERQPAGIEVAKDIEPRVTLRGHSGAVTCVGLDTRDGLAYSGGIDGAIKVWNLPQSPFGLYSEYGSANRQLARTLECHTDAVWDLAVQPSNPRRFVSASADGTLRLWDTSLSRANLRSYILPARSDLSYPQPVAVCFPRAPETAFNTFFVAGFRGGQVARFDIATGEAEGLQGPAGVQGPVTALSIAPPTSGGSAHTIFTAYADGIICRYDSGRSPTANATIIPAHSDICSALAVSPDNLQVATGGASGEVCLWDTRRLEKPLYTANMHQPRSGEGCLALEFAPPSSIQFPNHTSSVLVSAGADGVVQLLVLPSCT